ncbi:MAG: hypothetical protein OXG85_02580 [Chloroflexi bacterium]|nr:hypothetical protein [Chloroflexota bacterium]
MSAGERGVAELLAMDAEGVAVLADVTLEELIRATNEEGCAGLPTKTELPLAKA